MKIQEGQEVRVGLGFDNIPPGTRGSIESISTKNRRTSITLSLSFSKGFGCGETYHSVVISRQRFIACIEVCAAAGLG